MKEYVLNNIPLRKPIQSRKIHSNLIESNSRCGLIAADWLAKSFCKTSRRTQQSSLRVFFMLNKRASFKRATIVQNTCKLFIYYFNYKVENLERLRFVVLKKSRVAINDLHSHHEHMLKALNRYISINMWVAVNGNGCCERDSP